MTKEIPGFIKQSELLNAYKKNFPTIISIARNSSNNEIFKQEIALLLKEEEKNASPPSDIKKKALKSLIRLIENDGTEVDEFSTGQRLPIQTMSYLRQYLREEPMENETTDLFIDLYHLLRMLYYPKEIIPNRTFVKQQMSRWPTGMDNDVIAIREENKARIMKRLIQKIEKSHNQASRYRFEKDASPEEKENLVKDWWGTSRFHLAMALKSPSEINNFLNGTLSEETMRQLIIAQKKKMPFFVTPYYLSLLNIHEEGYDDETIRSYILYSKELIDTYGEIKAWEKEDIVEAGKPNAAGWLLPEGHNIHRRYPEVAILIPDSMGRACGGLCSSCQRMYDFQSERLNFEFEQLKPKDSWDKKLRGLMNYFETDSQLRDILITGGDALMSQNATLRKILDAIVNMAIRKRKANENRPDGTKYAELLRVRIGSRLLAYLPFRVTDELISILKNFKAKASEVGVRQFMIQTHFQTSLEVTPEAKQAIRMIQSAGWSITNQLVYTATASRRGHTAKLRQTLNSVGVVCYYTFSVKGFHENYAVYAPNSRSQQERFEEKVFGLVPKDKSEELRRIVRDKQHVGKAMKAFLKENGLLFASTDRSVINLPAIGKSMTFVTVGITAEGKRILRYEHDASRKHSPIIDKMGQIYIVENKSIAAYMRQLHSMGENIKDYQSIWSYTEGITEPRFDLYNYPAYPFGITPEMTNLSIEEQLME